MSHLLRPRKPGEEMPDPPVEPGRKSYVGLLILLASVAFICIRIGCQWPRDLELESTKPIEFRYEVTPEAAKYLVQKAFAGCPTSAD
ncbi:hypothetical protein D3C85_1360060 [compost metagenome]